jgi:homoserine dehydrogenase
MATGDTRVALLGFGTVGRSVARILTEHPPPGVRLTHIFNRDVARKKVAWVPADVRWTDDIDEVFTSDATVIVELIGGRNPASLLVRRALESGRSVVTANKQLIAHEGPALARLAVAQRQHLRFEAAVAGGIPVIGALREGIAGDHVNRITGILNGTCNFILTSMEHEGAAFADALARAQELGYAEADPTDDVEGYDARAKLAILCAVGLRVPVAPETISCRPITLVDAIDFRYAGELGCTIRQISQAAIDDGAPDRIVASVRPSVVPKHSPLARVDGSQNIIVARGQYGGDTVYSGSGAGGGPTSVAIVSDLVALSGARGEPRSDIPATDGAIRVDSEFVTAHYLRFIVRDSPGILASIAQSLAAQGINIDAVLQLPAGTKDALPFVVTIEPCAPATLAGAMAEISALGFHVCPPVDLPLMSGSHG